MLNEDAYYDGLLNRYQAQYDRESEISDHASYLEEIRSAIDSLIDAISEYDKSEYKGERFSALDVEELKNAAWECEHEQNALWDDDKGEE